MIWVHRGLAELEADDPTLRAGGLDICFSSPARPTAMFICQVWRVYQKAARAAGIGGLGTHSLRHTYRSWLDSVGTPVGVQQELMRHTDVSTTMQYGEAFTDDMAKAPSKAVHLPLNGAQASARRAKSLKNW